MGGIQSITTINGPVTQTIINLNGAEAQRVIEAAAAYRAQIVGPAPDRKERVSLTWKRLDTDAAVTDRKRSPDKAIIAEIDPKAHAVLFTDDMSHVKREMLDAEAYPFKNVYFVDVEISRVESGKITAYRIVGYHGKEELEEA